MMKALIMPCNTTNTDVLSYYIGDLFIFLDKLNVKTKQAT